MLSPTLAKMTVALSAVVSFLFTGYTYKGTVAIVYSHNYKGTEYGANGATIYMIYQGSWKTDKRCALSASDHERHGVHLCILLQM